MNVIMWLSVFACRKPDYHLLDPDRNNLGSDGEEAILETFHLDETLTGLENEIFEDTQEIHPDDIQPNMRKLRFSDGLTSQRRRSWVPKRVQAAFCVRFWNRNRES